MVGADESYRPGPGAQSRRWDRASHDEVDCAPGPSVQPGPATGDQRPATAEAGKAADYRLSDLEALDALLGSNARSASWWPAPDLLPGVTLRATGISTKRFTQGCVSHWLPSRDGHESSRVAAPRTNLCSAAQPPSERGSLRADLHCHALRPYPECNVSGWTNTLCSRVLSVQGSAPNSAGGLDGAASAVPAAQAWEQARVARKGMPGPRATFRPYAMASHPSAPGWRRHEVPSQSDRMKESNPYFSPRHQLVCSSGGPISFLRRGLRNWGRSGAGTF